jgi:hypothetical protein
MHLLFIHGPAAAGKYTVAKELAELTGFELYHNHLVVDEVLKTHPFGTPGFVSMRDKLWRDFFAQFPGVGREKIIFTFNPENSVPQEFIDWLFAELPRRGVKLTSVEITAAEEVLEARMGSSQRQQFKKLTDPALYRQLRDRGVFASPVIPRSDLRVNSGELAPPESADFIGRELGL